MLCLVSSTDSSTTDNMLRGLTTSFSVFELSFFKRILAVRCKCKAGIPSRDSVAPLVLSELIFSMELWIKSVSVGAITIELSWIVVMLTSLILFQYSFLLFVCPNYLIKNTELKYSYKQETNLYKVLVISIIQDTKRFIDVRTYTL